MARGRGWGTARSLEARWLTIREKMHASAAHLRTQGAIVSRLASGRRVWTLRYYTRDGDRPVQRTIYLGGDDQPTLLARARLLLAEYRSRTRGVKEVAAAARMAATIAVALKRIAAGARRGRR
jgi:hypothetical protein